MRARGLLYAKISLIPLTSVWLKYFLANVPVVETPHLSSWNCTRNFSFTQAHKWMVSFIFFLFKLREVTNVSHYYIYQIIVSEMKYCFEMLLFFLKTASENCFLFHRFSDWNRIWIIEVSRYWDLPAESLDIISS